MNCEKIQELILTDYLDGQMQGKQKECVEQHLLRCFRCREFLEHARKTVVEPFTRAGRDIPPEFIWARIRESIIAEKERPAYAVPGFLEKLISRFRVLSPYPVIGTVIMAIFIIGIAIQFKTSTTARVKSEVQEQIEYLVSVTEMTPGNSMNEKTGFGTVIEEYFL
ncbi:MAG: hypothetical protein PHE58_06280 [Candidatus Omnitrophica bacterium]|nr:hypothetical protein [Candidatus Omnitrophota bacterium]